MDLINLFGKSKAFKNSLLEKNDINLEEKRLDRAKVIFGKCIPKDWMAMALKVWSYCEL